MADLTAERVGDYEALHQSQLGSAVANTGASWYKGALLAFNATGLLVRASDTSGLRIAGEAMETVTSAAAGYVTTYRFGHTMALPIISGTWATGAAYGLDACMIDDNGVTNGATATNDIRIGRVVRRETIRGTDCMHVEIARHGLSAYAGT